MTGEEYNRAFNQGFNFALQSVLSRVEQLDVSVFTQGWTHNTYKESLILEECPTFDRRGIDCQG